MSITDIEPRIYVGTYGKYNSGSIAGGWIDLEGHDKETFLEACRDLHKDDPDPEFMFQDWEGIPDGFVSESYIKDELFEWLSFDENEREIIAHYAEAVGSGFDPNDAIERYVGTYDSGADYAEQFAEECMHYKAPSWLVIDWDATWNSNLRHDYTYTVSDDNKIWIFNNN